MENQQEPVLKLLRDVGLTDLEAVIYIWLLQHESCTGYRIASKTDKPVANTYKALKSLEQKGAVLSDSTRGKLLYAPVPVKQFLHTLETDFSRKKQELIQAVDTLDTHQEIKGIYALHSVALVYDKAIEMIRSAERSIAVDSFPAPLMKLKAHLETRGRDEIITLVHKYDNTPIKNVRQVRGKKTEISLSPHPGQWMAVIKDAKEALIAFFSLEGNELLHGMWIRDPFISLILYNGFAVECNLMEIYDRLYDDKDDKIQRIKQAIRGYQDIYEQFMIAEEAIFCRNKR